MFAPRKYQADAEAALYQYFEQNTGNPLIVLPTGAGKSLVIANFVRGIFNRWPDQRVVMLTHVKELIEQNHDKLVSVWPDAPVGIFSAGIGRRDMFDSIIFAGIQSVYNKARLLGRFDLVIVDECHLINHRADGMYRQFLADQQAMNPHLKVIGFTATPFRTGHGDITKAEEPIFTDVAYEKPLLELIDEGYLSPLVPKKTDAEIDLSSVHVRGGEYVQKELQAATDRDDLTQAAVKEIITQGADRRSWLIFCTGIDHSYHVRDALQQHGITAETITSRTTSADRERIIADYKAGRVKALTNANVLTTGFDAPETDLIAFLRATHSPVLYLQMAGRGTRLAPNKANCLVLDFAGNVMRHGPLDQIKAWDPSKKRKQDAPSKACPECKTIVATAVRECPDCGHEFEFVEAPQHEARAATMAILSNQVVRKEPECHEVSRVRYTKHVKRGSVTPPSLRVDYLCGLRWFSEWICIQHTGYAQGKARAWWRERLAAPLPETVDQALNVVEYLKEPARIWVDENQKFPRILSYEFESRSKGGSHRDAAKRAEDHRGAASVNALS